MKKTTRLCDVPNLANMSMAAAFPLVTPCRDHVCDSNKISARDNATISLRTFISFLVVSLTLWLLLHWTKHGAGLVSRIVRLWPPAVSLSSGSVSCDINRVGLTA